FSRSFDLGMVMSVVRLLQKSILLNGDTRSPDLDQFVLYLWNGNVFLNNLSFKLWNSNISMLTMFSRFSGLVWIFGLKGHVWKYAFLIKKNPYGFFLADLTINN
ncbi:hypothetical protein C1645_746341, partial [Glomus cerebriforme]